RSRGSSRGFWETVNRNPARLQKMLLQAQATARPPVERVVIRLNRYEDHLQERLKAVQSPPTPSAALAAAQHSAKNLRVRINKYDAAIGESKRYLREVAASEPYGLRARVNGSHHRWERRLAAAEARYAVLTDKRASLSASLCRAQERAASLEKSERGAHRENLRTAAVVENIARLRGGLERAGACRARLNIFPALAWGGIAMALAATGVVAVVDQAIDPDSDRPPAWAGATDIWGVPIPT